MLNVKLNMSFKKIYKRRCSGQTLKVYKNIDLKKRQQKSILENSYVDTKQIIEVLAKSSYFENCRVQKAEVQIQRRVQLLLAIITTIWKLQKNSSNYLWQVSIFLQNLSRDSVKVALQLLKV